MTARPKPSAALPGKGAAERLRCGECGRFMAGVADSSTPFGDCTMSEPPDDEYYCAPCALRLEEEAVQRDYLPDNWIPAAWERRAAQRLGLVRVGPKGAAWAHWSPPDRIPEGYEMRS